MSRIIEKKKMLEETQPMLYDAGVRPGETVAKGMIAVRIAPDMRMTVIGAASYFERQERPGTTQDLTTHNCINPACQPTAVLTPGNSRKAPMT